MLYHSCDTGAGEQDGNGSETEDEAPAEAGGEVEMVGYAVSTELLIDMVPERMGILGYHFANL